MTTKTSTWVIVVETVLLVLFIFLLFKCCNVPITSDHKVEDSLARVGRIKDSIYKIRQEEKQNQLDSANSKAGYWEDQFRKADRIADKETSKAVNLLIEIDRLKKTGNIDSLNKAIEDLKSAYLSCLSLMNDISNSCDSALTSKDTAMQRAKELLSLAGQQITDLTSQRDGYARDEKAKDSIIDKLQSKRKANNLWAKIATVWGTVATFIAIFKK